MGDLCVMDQDDGPEGYLRQPVSVNAGSQEIDSEDEVDGFEPFHAPAAAAAGAGLTVTGRLAGLDAPEVSLAWRLWRKAILSLMASLSARALLRSSVMTLTALLCFMGSLGFYRGSDHARCGGAARHPSAT